ncbi:hypothetical protein ACFP63_15400 [Oerskovia jenensis]|uniref:DUF1453 domain-containing protein n=1 Tax=Oerskovia jenensis TaxID=162169 RepID=A0ABS2LDM0_9CELL|nr:hypothetical protein [Oerskovia jenensis]MBM7478510.1 hypothetical protein [Oerskovia jenensis]
MNPENLEPALIAVAVLCWLGYRQTTWRAVSARLWTLPAVLGAVGLLSLSSVVAARPTALDLVVVTSELVVSVGVGTVIGAMTSFRTIDPAAAPAPGVTARRRARASAAGATLEARAGWVALALWIALIVARLVTGTLAGAAGAHLATSAGVILLLLAANRAARVLVVTTRAGRLARERTPSDLLGTPLRAPAQVA